MRKLKNKLNNNSGVSILFALLLFLVASMVSIVIISASASSVKRTHYSSAMTQETLSLDSAVLMMNNEMDNVVYTSVATKKKKDDSYGTPTITIQKSNNEFTSVFDSLIKEVSKDFLDDNLNSLSDFTIEVDNMNKVYVSCSILNNNSADDSLEITFNLSTEDDSDAREYLTYSIAKSITESQSGSERNPTYTKTSVVQWHVKLASGKGDTK